MKININNLFDTAHELSFLNQWTHEIGLMQEMLYKHMMTQFTKLYLKKWCTLTLHT